MFNFFFFQAEDGIRDVAVTGVQTCALPIFGATAEMDVSLRGFQVSPVIGVPQGVTVYVDGVRANEPDAHEVNFDLLDRKSTRLNSSHGYISYAVFCLKKKKKKTH